MRTEDPWLVMRYAPLLIDDRIYFPIAVPSPAGKWRTEEIGQGVTYVDPRTGAEYSRERNDMMNRASFAPVDRVQDLLDYLRPRQYRAVAVSYSDETAYDITLVTRAYISNGMGANVRSKLVVGLTSADQALIAHYRLREQMDVRIGSIAVAARLIEDQKATRFIRLARVLGETIWSV